MCIYIHIHIYMHTQAPAQSHASYTKTRLGSFYIGRISKNHQYRHFREYIEQQAPFSEFLLQFPCVIS